MRIGDMLYFSPKHKFLNLKWDDKKTLTDAFKNRVEGFYIEPTKKLNGDKNWFAVGVMCVTTIDFLARIKTGLLDDVGKRFEDWLRSNIKDFDSSDPDNLSRTLAYRFYDEFRNGLVHEGRIKNAGQFSYCFEEELVKVEDGIMVVNPGLLLNAIISSFEKYMHHVENEEFAFHQLRYALIRDFEKDVEYANR
jgi:hypothetical protein